jgi:putative acetyltransferase
VTSPRRSPFDKLTLRQAQGERPLAAHTASTRSGEARAVTGLRIRRATLSDARACAAVMRAAIRALPPDALPARARAAWASLPALYHRWAMGPGAETYLVAEEAGRLLGYAAIRGGELTAAFVRPRAQGAGVGRALVQAAARRARRGGARALHVLAARSAEGFYAALGFRRIAPARAPLPGGVALAAVRMRRAL